MLRRELSILNAPICVPFHSLFVDIIAGEMFSDRLYIRLVLYVKSAENGHVYPFYFFIDPHGPRLSVTIMLLSVDGMEY